MSTDVEARLRAALTARAELVRPEDLASYATVTPLRSRWQSPWVLLATASVVLLVLGVVLQGVGGRERSDRLAPEPDPDTPTIQLPADIGRDWKADDLSTPARLDLDGDGIKEKVDFLGEPTKKFDGRTRLQTTLSTTGEEAYGIAELGTTIGVGALEPVDADGNGDQELVLYYDDLNNGGYPLVYDLRDGLLVQAPPEDPQLLARGEEVVPGSKTEFYDRVHLLDYWFEGGSLRSSRSVSSYARGNMMRMSPKGYVADAWTWTLDPDGVLRHGDRECLVQSYDSTRACGLDQQDTLTYVPPERAAYVEPGGTLDTTDAAGYGFTARVDGAGTLVVDGFGQHIEQALDVPDPVLGSVPPSSIFFDGASVVVTSDTDPSVVQVFTQNDDRMVLMDPVGEIGLTNDDDQRTWLTENGAVLSAVAADDGAWELWQWVMVSRTEIAALPWGTGCIDDVDDPTSIRAC